MSIYDTSIESLMSGRFDWDTVRGKTLLIVNVASKCGRTPQYEGLQEIHGRYADRGFSVVGVPCNQFAAEEPGSPEEIAEFCLSTYQVTFPMLQKIDVNGPGRHELFSILTTTTDSEGVAGAVEWNFEKFVISPAGEPYARFRSPVEPTVPEIAEAIEESLPG